MPTQFSLAHLTVLDASPPEMVDLAHQAGYDFVGLRLTTVTPTERPWPLMTDAALMAETKARMADTGVGVLDVELVRLTPDVDVSGLERLVATAAELGARHVLTQAHDPVFDRVAERYAAFCDLAAQYGLTSDIEFLTWTDMRDLKTTAHLLKTVNRPNSGICIDTLHFARSQCRVEEIDALPASWFHFAQVADAPAVAPFTRDGLIRTAREARLLPGEGGIDLTGILSRLPERTPLAIEIPNAALAGLLPPVDRVRAARLALAEVLLTFVRPQSKEALP